MAWFASDGLISIDKKDTTKSPTAINLKHVLMISAPYCQFFIKISNFRATFWSQAGVSKTLEFIQAVKQGRYLSRKAREALVFLDGYLVHVDCPVNFDLKGVDILPGTSVMVHSVPARIRIVSANPQSKAG